MRFKSRKVGSYQVFAVTGMDTVSFGIAADLATASGLLGFAVEREDPVKNERYFVYGFKVFKEVFANPPLDLRVLTFDQPVQSFVWDDFSAKPGQRFTYRFYPLKGTPKNLDRSSPPIPITVETEPLTAGTHDVYFNRGVASSQAYAREFKNQKPDNIADPAERQRARNWLSRRLDEKLFEFIDAAKQGDTLLGAFYEFRYRPAADRLKAALDRGVIVKLVLDGKDNGYTDKEGKVHEAFPLEDNKVTVQDAGLPASAITWRKKNPDAIAHNKFMVLLRGAARTPEAVWTGSTNLSDGMAKLMSAIGCATPPWRPPSATIGPYWRRTLAKTAPGHGRRARRR